MWHLDCKWHIEQTDKKVDIILSIYDQPVLWNIIKFDLSFMYSRVYIQLLWTKIIFTLKMIEQTYQFQIYFFYQFGQLWKWNVRTDRHYLPLIRYVYARCAKNMYKQKSRISSRLVLSQYMEPTLYTYTTFCGDISIRIITFVLLMWKKPGQELHATRTR
jgi:hypothetical protein